MPPTLPIGLHLEARRHARRICHVADGARRAGRSAAASLLAFPRPLRVSLADPAAAVAARAWFVHLITECAATCWSAISTLIAATAEAARTAIRHLCRHFAARVPHRIFPCREGSVMPVLIEIRIGTFGEEGAPVPLKRGSRFPEARGRAGSALARVRARIEPAPPIPGVCGVWVARAQADRADVHVVVIDQPSLSVGVRIAATGESAHAP